MEQFAQLFKKFPSIAAERDFSFSRHTTIGCGGTASLSVSCDCVETAAEVICYLQRERIPHILLGAGANVLPADGHYEGVVVRITGKKLRAEGDYLLAEAGVTGGSLCRFARQCQVTGFEPFTGIPMTVGGGTAMNAGVVGGHFSDVVVEVKAVERGKVRVFSNRDCAFSEKESIFQSGIAVIEVLLRGRFSSRKQIEERTHFYRQRRAGLPKGRSMGCTFVNPEGLSAGKLLDECGLKGLQIGGARISEKHANFILNEGGTSKDVETIIGIAKETVYHRTGILLREEIRRIGQNT